MKYTRTQSGLPPLTLSDAVQITSVYGDAARALEDAITEIEGTLEESDLLEHFDAQAGEWAEEIQPVLDLYHDLQRAHLALTGGEFTERHDAVRLAQAQQERRSPVRLADRDPMGLNPLLNGIL